MNYNKIKSRTCAKKPRLNENHKKRRLELALKFEKLPSEYWSNVIFSDESTFRLCGTSGNQRVWREDGTRFDEENIIHTEKFGGGSLMVWGCITINGPCELVFLNGNMNQIEYKKVLQQHLIPIIQKNPEKPCVFQQNGAPCHTLKSIKMFFEDNKIELLSWAAQNPDLNSIEHVWAIIKRKLWNQKFDSFDGLQKEIMRIWKDEIDENLCRTLILSWRTE